MGRRGFDAAESLDPTGNVFLSKRGFARNAFRSPHDMRIGGRMNQLKLDMFSASRGLGRSSAFCAK